MNFFELPGPLAFVCEWPGWQIELTRVEIDAAPILEAAKRALLFWDEQATQELFRPPVVQVG